VNVVDLMRLFPANDHPHGMDALEFNDLFTRDVDVVFAFHGYARALHELIHGQSAPERFHVRGFREEGTTTTPFDMVVLNGMSRFHLAALALRFSGLPEARVAALTSELNSHIEAAVRHARDHFADPPEIQDWVWTND
jgi:xylulose-5-phosphate/fructose-6-phosphate phosphoketolase